MTLRRQEGQGETLTTRAARRSGALLSLRSSLLLPFAFLLLSYLLLPSTALAGAWVKQSSGTLSWLHAVFFVDAERGWAAGGKGALLSTTDGGAHWQVRRRVTEDNLRDIYFADAQHGWIVCERSVYQLLSHDEAFAPRSYLLQTTDGGDSWARVEVTGADAEAVLARITFADAQHGWIYGEQGALFATQDGGATWARQRVPTRKLLLAATFHDAARGWIVGAGSTILLTEDGGATWREGQLETPTAQTSTSTSTSTSNSTQNQPLASSSHATQTPAAAVVAAVRFNAVSFVDARRGWAVGSLGAIYATTNGGRTWRAMASDVEANLTDVKFYDEREGRATASDGTVIHTTDGGQTWRVERTDNTHPLERFAFIGRARGWAVGFGGTIITTNAADGNHTGAPTPTLGGNLSNTPRPL